MSQLASWIGSFGISIWTLGFILAVVVTLVVVALLLGIIWQARRILTLARTAATVVAEIDVNTRSVWALRDTNVVARQIVDGAKAIDANAAAIVSAVSSQHGERSAA